MTRRAYWHPKIRFMPNWPQRKRLEHQTPSWVKEGSLFFITICALPRTQNHLCSSNVASALLKSAEHYQLLGKWWVKLFLLMPDHIHALVAVPRTASLPTVVRTWKAYQNVMLGIKWQSGFFDHRLRSDESEKEKVHYIRTNPVRAGLVAQPGDWPHVWPVENDTTGRASPP
jgi:REP element-mobilizing transposase RayT